MIDLVRHSYINSPLSSTISVLQVVQLSSCCCRLHLILHRQIVSLVRDPHMTLFSSRFRFRQQHVLSCLFPISFPPHPCRVLSLFLASNHLSPKKLRRPSISSQEASSFLGLLAGHLSRGLASFLPVVHKPITVVLAAFLDALRNCDPTSIIARLLFCLSSCLPFVASHLFRVRVSSWVSIE